MRQPFFEDLMTAMYPSGLLHTFGVNGKISGSVGAVGEMQEVLPLLHSPRGCGFHYRYSARRRHQPFYSVLTSNLEERDIICGGEEKLRQAIRDAWSRYRPGLIMVIPSPISDILNEDVRSVCAELRREGISVVGVQSELFSHRDKNYTRNRLKELAHQTITGDNRLEMELKGCGFTEALYALVEQVMEPSAQIPHSINIETVGWGSEGKAALRELEVFLNGCGIQVNTWIPSAPLSSLVHAPAAELNLVKRVRWARRMREKFGTAYLHIGGAGRYAGLDGICTFYRDIGQALRMEAAVEPVVLAARAQALEETAEARRRLGQARAVLVSRSIQQAPFELKSYVRDYGLSVSHLCVILTPESRKNLNVTPALEDVVEATIYLSGLGFENGGLAAAHAVNDGFAQEPQAHGMYHGEKVAFGTLVQLVLEKAPQEELEQVLGFLRDTGLPLTLAQLGVKEIVPETLKKVAEAAVVPTQSTKNLRADITAQEVYDAILEADRIGRDYLAR